MEIPDPPVRPIGAGAHRFLSDQSGNRAQRDVQPAGPMPGLVGHLVDGLVQLVDREDVGVGARVGPRGRSVTVAERSAVALDPFPGPRGQLTVRLVVQPVVGRVFVGAEHPGDIAKWRVRPPPLLQRLARFTLEVDQQPVVRRAQHLPQVKVTVHPLNRDVPVGHGEIAALYRSHVPVEFGNTGRRCGQAFPHVVDRQGRG